MAAIALTTNGSTAVKNPAPAMIFHFVRASAIAGLNRIGRRGTERYWVTIHVMVPTMRFVQNALAIDSAKLTMPISALATPAEIISLTLRNDRASSTRVRTASGIEKKPDSRRNFGRCSLYKTSARLSRPNIPSDRERKELAKASAVAGR